MGRCTRIKQEANRPILESLRIPAHSCARNPVASGEKEHYMKTMRTLITTTLGGILAMTQLATAQTPNPASDPRIDPQVRSFLAELNKDSSPFWELPQPKPQEILTGLQSQTTVDTSGVTVTEQTISQDGRRVKLYVMKPEHVSGKPGVLLFIHGGVWTVGN